MISAGALKGRQAKYKTYNKALNRAQGEQRFLAKRESV